MEESAALACLSIRTLPCAKRTAGYLAAGNLAVINGLVVRKQALALYRAGAVWFKPPWHNGTISLRPPSVRLTEEALQHPDVVEIIWGDGAQGPWGLDSGFSAWSGI